MTEPFIFTHRDEFFALPPEEQPPHIWECLQYLEWRRSQLPLSDQAAEASTTELPLSAPAGRGLGGGASAPLPGVKREGEVGESANRVGVCEAARGAGPGGGVSFEESEIDRNVGLLRHIAMDVCKAIADKLREQGAYKNRFDPRWPRYHPNSKKPEYLTGCFPPLMLCMRDDDATWAGQSAEALADNGRELVAWAATPAGRHGITPADIATAREKVEELARSTEAAYQAKKALDEADARLDEARKKLRDAGG